MTKLVCLLAGMGLVTFLGFTIDAQSRAPVDRPTVELGKGMIFASGRVEGTTPEIELRPRLADRIADVLVCEGQTVNEGDVLLQVCDKQYRHEVELAAAALELAEAQLDAQTVSLILAYRADGNKFTHPVELLGMRYQPKSSGRTARGRGRRGGRPSPRAPAELRSGVDGSRLDTVLDRLTATSASRLLGLVNVNTAAAKVLAALPGLDEALAARIVEARSGLAPEDRATPAWLYTQGVLDAEAFKSAAPLLTARSFQYRLRCVGFGRPVGRFRIVEAALDLAGKTPRISYLRDITRLGLPFALDVDVEER